MAMLRCASNEDTEQKLPARAEAMIQLHRDGGAAALVSSGTRGTNCAHQAQEFGSTARVPHQENPVRCGGNRVEFEQMPANLKPPARAVRQSQGMPNLALELTHYSVAPGPRAAFVHVAPHGPGATL